MLSYYILISSGKVSAVTLFYNNARRQVGLVGYWDLVAFDKVAGMKVIDPDTIQIMKDYMANGRFSRGVTQVIADASMVFVGDLTIQGNIKRLLSLTEPLSNKPQFASLPEEVAEKVGLIFYRDVERAVMKALE